MPGIGSLICEIAVEITGIRVLSVKVYYSALTNTQGILVVHWCWLV